MEVIYNRDMVDIGRRHGEGGVEADTDRAGAVLSSDTDRAVLSSDTDSRQGCPVLSSDTDRAGASLF